MMISTSRPNRRAVLAGLGASFASVPTWAQTADQDQSGLIQDALTKGSLTGRVTLPPGSFRVSELLFMGGMVIEGAPGLTWLVADGASAGLVSAQTDLVLRDIGFTGDSGDAPLLSVDVSGRIVFERCQFRDGPGIGLQLTGSGTIVRDCRFIELGDAAIHALDSENLLISGNMIEKCGSAGIRVWRSEPGNDGAIVTNNRISAIDWQGGGNGQNGNGINVFRADGVIVSDNHIEDCAFTAIRLNATRNTIVSGNQCFNSGEVAIFSEFEFSGSVISDNIVDGAAGGISMTNLDAEGHLAVCSGNIVRNILPASEVNPDTTPFGIAAEADAAVTGNVVENCPGTALLAGWGPYLRDVSIADNVVVKSKIGIGVSLADGAGNVTISSNRIDATDHDLAGMLWAEISEPDLAAVVDRYPHVTID